MTTDTMAAYRIYLGKYSRLRKDSSERRVTAVEVINHPTRDASIIKLKCQPNTTSISTIPLSDSVPGKGEMVRATGFGWTYSNDPSSVASSLQKIDLPVEDSDICHAVDHLSVRAYEFCAGSGNNTYANVCHGDSGGPIMDSINNSYTLVGITSRGVGSCPEHARYAVFLRISDIHDWVTTNTQEKVDICPPSGSSVTLHSVFTLLIPFAMTGLLCY